MRKIRSKDTKPEIILRQALWSIGLRYRLNVINLPGCPDIVFIKNKVAIFVDGEFWHGYNWENKKLKIKTNQHYWIKKIEGNIYRDIKNKILLEGLGYKVLRFWERDIRRKKENCIQVIIHAIKS